MNKYIKRVINGGLSFVIGGAIISSGWFGEWSLQTIVILFALGSVINLIAEALMESDELKKWW